MKLRENLKLGKGQGASDLSIQKENLALWTFIANSFSAIYMETIQASACSLMTPATFQKNRQKMFSIKDL